MARQPWLYLTTYRSERVVTDELAGTVAGDVRVEHVETDEPVAEARAARDALDEPRHVLVEPMNPLESDTGTSCYVSFLNDLKEHLIETGLVAVFHCTEHGTEPAQREITLTMADVV